jgi:fluoride exporter
VSLGVWLLAALLGGCGAVARFLVDALVSQRLRRDFPLGTLVVNLSGAVGLGVTVGATLRGSQSVLIGAAAIGAYTTFSTWMFETHRLAQEGKLGMAGANALVSLGAGLLAAVVGRAIGMHL